MKLFRKLMAGAMAIAMLSVYTVAFASGTVSGVSSTSGATVTGAGRYIGDASSVFLMKLPTAAAANASLAFTIDPQEVIKNSPPSNAIMTGTDRSTFGTVVFSTVSGTGSDAVATYKDESAPLKVISMSSTDVTVNMFASLSDTKMKLSATSGYTANPTDHLYLAVKVSTMSGTTPVNETESVTALGARNATVLKAIPGNFKSDNTTFERLVSGAATSADNATAAARLGDDNWNYVEYTVTGTSNPNADWQIPGMNAPNLTIKWVIDPGDATIFNLPDPTGNSYTAQLDKKAYKAGETVTLFVKPNSAEATLTTATLNYIKVASDDTMDEEATVSATVVSTPVNGVYKATFTLPSNMARPTSPAGNVPTYKAPTWEIEVG